MIGIFLQVIYEIHPWLLYSAIVSGIIAFAFSGLLFLNDDWLSSLFVAALAVAAMASPFFVGSSELDKVRKKTIDTYYAAERARDNGLIPPAGTAPIDVSGIIASTLPVDERGYKHSKIAHPWKDDSYVQVILLPSGKFIYQIPEDPVSAVCRYFSPEFIACVGKP